MQQYRDGTVSVTIGSAYVTGSGTAFTDYIQAGDLFQISGEGVLYSVASVSMNTLLTLSSNYAGDSDLSGASYRICIDFTSNYALPEIHSGDKDWPTILNKALVLIDIAMQDFEDRITVLEP